MKERKDIDSLFQERFEGFEASPPPESWERIKAQLNKKKEDRKIIPLWWRVAGVAALVALLLTVGNWIFSPTLSPSETIVEHQTNSETTPELNETNAENTFEKNGVELATEDESDQRFTEDAVQPEDQLVRPETSPRTATQSKKAIAGDASESQKSTLIKNSNNVRGNEAKTDALIPAEERIKKAIFTEETVATDLPTDKNEEIASEKSSEIIDAPINSDAAGLVTNADQSSENKDTDTDTTESLENSNKKSLLEEIEKQQNAEAVADTEQTSTRNWEITPSVGPVYYSSLGDGSSLDPSFADNQQSGEVNVSYGIQVSYQLNDRLSIRSGVHNVNLGYTTEGVEVVSGPVSSALKTINYASDGTVVTVLDEGALNTGMPSPENNLGDFTPKNTGGNAQLQQQLSYYEVPLELKYALVNSRLGVNMIGGVSTLFLGDNEVTVEDGAFRSTLGAANNLNDVSFSTNIGFGLDYKFSKRLKFNIEPMFKYQLNPYTDSSVEFKPYYFGVYSGLSFKF